MAWISIWFGIFNTCGGVWSNGVGKNWETKEEHDEDCVEEGFKLASAKFDRDSNGGKEALGTANCSISIWDGSKLESAWSRKNSLHFENNFQIFLLSGIPNTSIFKVHVLH